jgi:sugar lactone lactonase YvrE
VVVARERVAGRLRWYTPGPQPNGLQAAADGVWVIDQVDLDVYLLGWEDGRVLRRFHTQTQHSSGITFDGETVWVASTWAPLQLFRYALDGTELRRLETPGRSETGGAHGLEWIDGKLWVTVPPSATTYELDPNDGRVLRQFAAPGTRPHGLAWDGRLLWVAETNQRTINGYTLDGALERVLEMAPGPAEGPNPHGLTYYRGELWYCDADTRAMCTIRLGTASAR